MEVFELKGDNFAKVMSFVKNGAIPEAWRQPIDFVGDTFRLYQKLPGPCGLLSALQAYILVNRKKNPDASPNELLIQSTLQIMLKMRQSFVFCQLYDEFNKKLVFYATDNYDVADAYLKDSGFMQCQIAVLLLTISFVVLTGPSLLISYAFPEPFIDLKGYTTMQFVLLLTTGLITDSLNSEFCVHGAVLVTGVVLDQDIGMLLVDEEGADQKVGYPLLNPNEKVWIIYYGGHFTSVIYIDGEFREFNTTDHDPIEYTVCGPNHILRQTLDQIINTYK